MNISPLSEWTLRVTDDNGAEVSIALGSQPKCFGRGDEEVDIRLLSGQVSRRHAEIWVNDAGQLMLRDLGSTNGTAINGIRIEGEQALNHEDQISIARWSFVAHNPAVKRSELTFDAPAGFEDPFADDSDEMISSTDSIVAIDALLDSRGNLRDEQVLAAKADAKVGMPVAPKAQVVQQVPQPEPMQKPEIRAQLKPVKPTLPVLEEAPQLTSEDAAAIAMDAGMTCAGVDDFVDSHAGRQLFFSGSQAGLPALEDSHPGMAAHRPNPSARASDLHLVGEGRAPGVSAADLCAVQAFADRQLVVPNIAKRRRLLCEFAVSPVFARNIAAVVAVQDGKMESICGPAASLTSGTLHIEKILVRKAAEERRAVVAWDAHFADGTSAVAVCCPLSGGEFLYAITTFENATPAWMAMLAQTACMDRLIRKSWQAIEKIRRPGALAMEAAA